MRALLRKLTGWPPASVNLPGIDPLRLYLHERKPDIWISDPIRRGEVFDANVLSVIRAFLPRDGVFVDVGANLGWFTVIAACLAKQGHVVAIEPDPDNVKLLRRNVRANDLRNVMVFAAAAGAAPGSASLFRSYDNQGDHRLALASERRGFSTVEVTTLSAATANLDVASSTCVVKIDTQGSETAVLRGADAFLRKTKGARLIIEFWPHGLVSCGSSGPELIEVLRGYGWLLWQLLGPKQVARITHEQLFALATGEMAPETHAYTDLVAVDPADSEAIAILQSWEE